MKILRIPNAGATGVVKDLSAHELPAGVWTDCKNVRFYDGTAHQSFGHVAVYGSTSVAPLHVLPVTLTTGDHYWIYAGTGKVYAVTYDSTGTSGVHTNITRQTSSVDVDYSGNINEWTSCVLGGIPILNAGNVDDVPQYWDLDIAGRLEALSNWPAATYCKSMRAYKNFLIALNITKSATRYPFMVKWSSPADPGALPSTWDETDATNDAGELDLAEGYDAIVDGLQLRDSFMIYKESSIWKMDYVGGQSIFRVAKVIGSSGALNRNCIAEVNGAHFVFTSDDVILHDGSSSKSILDNITRRFLFDDINGSYAQNAFVFNAPFSNEVFVCYPSNGATNCDKAMTWNYQDRTVSFRELPNVNHASVGTLGSASNTWGNDSEPWGGDQTAWNASGQEISDRSKVVLASNDTQLYRMDTTYTFAGSIPEASLTRTGMLLSPDENKVTVTSVRPRIKGTDGETVTISIGYNDSDPYATPTYPSEGVMSHTIGTTVKNSCFVTGRYIAIKIETDSVYQWSLDSLDIEFQEAGRW